MSLYGQSHTEIPIGVIVGIPGLPGRSSMRTRLILKNTTFLIGAQVFNMVGRLIFSIFLARYLGVASLGDIFFALVIIELFYIITDFGLGIIVTREVASDKAKGATYLANTLTIKLILDLVSASLVVIFIHIFPATPTMRTLVYILIPTIFFNSFFASFTYIFRAHEDMKQESIISLVSNLLYLSLGFLAIHWKLSIFVFAFITTLSTLINFGLAAVIYSLKYQAIKLGFQMTFARRLLKASIPVGVGIILSMVYNRVDVILLSFFKGSSQVGLYAAAYKLISIFLFVPYFLATSMFPAMSEWKTQEKMQELKNLIEKSVKAIMIIAIPAAVFVSLVPERIVLRIYGDQFLASAPALGILVWYLVIMFAANIFNHLLFLSHARAYAVFNLIALAISISLNLCLIPVFGFLGVAVTAVASVSVLVFLSYLKIRSSLFTLGISKKVLTPFIASLGIVFFVYNNGSLNLFWLSFGSLFFYAIILYALKGITKEDFKLLLKICPF